jgi:replication-associated recombination protein RarA
LSNTEPSQERQERWKPELTVHGHDWSEVVSALQKCVRRGLEDDALYWAVELDRSGYGEFAFKRLRVIAMEDVGLADPNVIVQVQSLYEVWTALRKKRDDKNQPWRLALVMATMVCARAAKSRAVDHALLAYYGEDEVREIPDWALDKHTSRGWELKRGWKHFWDESTLLLDRENGELVHEPIPDPYRGPSDQSNQGQG